jgi:UPF0271 protein
MSLPIDLNADLGEGFGRWRLGDDEALLNVVTSANVACGFHAGDPSIMRRVCAEAVTRGVRVGAQVGYRDLAGFGRRAMDYDPDELTAEVLYQLGALDTFARAAGDRVRYVKPHGALYNRIVHDEVQAAAVVDAVRTFNASLPLLGLPGSAVLRLAADAGLAGVAEAFADRAYTADGRLVPRGVQGAVIDDPSLVRSRCVAFATGAPVSSLDGTPVRIVARSVCLHSDTPGAAALAASVRVALREAGVPVEAFT